MDAERQATHSAECWRWHLGCAVARAERLERELAILCDEDQRKLLEVERLRAALARLTGYPGGAGHVAREALAPQEGDGDGR